MITFEKNNNELVRFLINEKNSESYVLKKENSIIGYGKINKAEDNKIEIFILPEYRGNGYGKILFKNLIDKINNLDFISITFDNNNIIAKRITEGFGGKQDSLVNGVVRYIIPL